MRVAAWVLGMVLTGCGAQQGREPPPQSAREPVRESPAEAEDGQKEKSSPFYIVLEGFEGGPGRHDHLSATFLGDVGLFHRTRIVTLEGEVTFGNQAPYSIWYEAHVAGTYPDNLWTTSPEPGGGFDSIVLKRFHGGSWRAVHGFKEPWEFAYQDYRLSRWWPGRLLVLFAPACCEDDRMVFHSFGAGPPPTLPTPSLRDGARVVDVPRDMKAFHDGSVVLSGTTSEGRSVLELWRSPSRPSEIVPLPCGERMQAIKTVDDLVVVGRNESGPCVVRLERGHVRDLGVPISEGYRVISYAPDAHGSEWIAVWDSDKSTLLTRREGEQWTPVPLPLPRFAGPTRPALEPSQVHATSNGDVWVLAHYTVKRDLDEYSRGVVLRNRPPTEVCWVELDGQRCEPYAEGLAMGGGP